MWYELVIPSIFYINDYGKSSLFKTPQSYGQYTFFHPRSLIQYDSGYYHLRYKEGWEWRLNRRSHATGNYASVIISEEEFCEIWANICGYEHHIPKHLESGSTVVLEELLDEN